jgi:drug/metabolite transporter (DMT)-like permease
MNWIFLTMVSAVILGVYDIAKKMSVRENAVPAVLMLSVSLGAAIWAPLIIASSWVPTVVPEILRVSPLDGHGHALLIGKSILVGASWIFAFYGMKHLPLSIASPIRSTSPLWTIMIAIWLLAERPSSCQWLGIFVVLGAFIRFSLLGAKEGIRFSRDRFVMSMLVGTLLGSFCSIYDKVLFSTEILSPATVQAWFTIYLVPIMSPLAIHWYRSDRLRTPFEYRRSILFICPLLLLTDFAYFTALADPDSLISVVTTIRRCSVLIPFLFGIRTLGEVNFRSKAVCVAAMLLGVSLLSFKGG